MGFLDRIEQPFRFWTGIHDPSSPPSPPKPSFMTKPSAVFVRTKRKSSSPCHCLHLRISAFTPNFIRVFFSYTHEPHIAFCLHFWSTHSFPCLSPIFKNGSFCPSSPLCLKTSLLPGQKSILAPIPSSPTPTDYEQWNTVCVHFQQKGRLKVKVGV